MGGAPRGRRLHGALRVGRLQGALEDLPDHTRRSNGEVVRITQLGTGNYNEKTAGLYADYSYMTADQRIGEDANRFFRNMQIGNLRGEYSYLGVAPVGLKPLIMRGINREIAKARAGEDAYLCSQDELADRPRGHRQALRGELRRRQGRPRHPRHLLPAARRPRQNREHHRALHRRAHARARPRLHVRRRPRHHLPELGGHDDAQHRAPRRDRLPRARSRVLARSCATSSSCSSPTT